MSRDRTTFRPFFSLKYSDRNLELPGSRRRLRREPANPADAAHAASAATATDFDSLRRTASLHSFTRDADWPKYSHDHRDMLIEGRARITLAVRRPSRFARGSRGAITERTPNDEDEFFHGDLASSMRGHLDGQRRWIGTRTTSIRVVRVVRVFEPGVEPVVFVPSEAHHRNAVRAASPASRRYSSSAVGRARYGMATRCEARRRRRYRPRRWPCGRGDRRATRSSVTA